VLTVVVVAPVLAYGRWISSRATISNAELYSFVALDSWRTVASGALEELFSIHSPWYVTGSLGIGEDGLLVQRFLRASVNGLPLWVTIAVFAVLAVASVRVVKRVAATRAEEPRVLQPMQLLTACTLAGVLVYPVLLRTSNALNVGFDFPVVARYSIGFAPLLAWLVLVAVQDRPLLTRGLAVLATATCLGLGLATW
jgi:hypothetical protein